MPSNSVTFSSTKNNISAEMRIWERKFLLFLIDCILLMIVMFYSHQSINSGFELTTFLKVNYLSYTYFLSIFLIFAFTFDLYDIEFVNKTRKVLPVSFFIGITCTSLYMSTTMLNQSLPFLKLPIFNFVAGFTVSLILWRVFYAAVIHVNLFTKKFILLTAEKF